MSQLTALILTLMLEVLILMLWWKFIDFARSDLKTYVISGIVASCLTHPLAWYANETLNLSLSQWTRIGIIEVVVFILEGLFYSYMLPLSLKMGLLLSLIANVFSFASGLLLIMFTQY